VTQYPRRPGGRTIGVLLLTTLLAASPPALALNPALDMSQYAHTAWSVREGFTKGTINALAQTPDGYLWLGTVFGLLRFDGVRTVVWRPPPSSPSLPSDDIETRPQTIGYNLADSPVGLAAWLSDHDAQTYQRIVRAFDGHPEGALTRDEILDNIMLYWLTNTGASAARLYWETTRNPLTGQVSLPAAFTVFPNELYRAPRVWVEKTYPHLIYFHEADKGGHFAAWEYPQLFAEEVRAAFRSLR